MLFFHLVVLLHRSYSYSNSCRADRMFEISSHKVSSILSPSKARIQTFFAKSSWSVLDDTVIERADILGVWYYCWVQLSAALSASGLTACYRNLHIGENSAYNDPTNLY